MSCSTTSIEEFAKTIPVSPPKVNNTMKPRAHSIGVENLGVLPFIVDNHLNTLTPVGTAIIIVADVKYARVSTSMPTINIWCPHTINPRRAMDIIA